MSRKEELIRYFCNTDSDKCLMIPVIDEILFIESQLANLKSLPFIKVYPSNPEMQKATPASKLYTQLEAQYNSTVRTLIALSGENGTGENSPLREWAKNYGGKKQ